ncbi:MAG: SAM-dependent methyltransferase [Spirochaetia bacterium]
MRSNSEHLGLVQEYYDYNTRGFIKYGQGGNQFAIHRAVWAPGVKTREGAMHYVNSVIAEYCASISAETVYDLGCGIGGSLFYLSTRLSSTLIGITISKEQAELARRIAEERNQKIKFIYGDYTERKTWHPKPEGRIAAFAVESFIHLPDPHLFFNTASSVMKQGDVLIICDDFLSETRVDKNRSLSDYTEYWHAKNLLTVEEIKSICSGFSLTQNQDLTQYLEIGRPRDKIISFAAFFGKLFAANSPWWRNIIGGNALQKCLRKGLVDYRLLVLQKD